MTHIDVCSSRNDDSDGRKSDVHSNSADRQEYQRVDSSADREENYGADPAQIGNQIGRETPEEPKRTDTQ